MTEEQSQRQKQIFQMRQSGQTLKHIAETFGISRQRVLQILSREGYETGQYFSQQPLIENGFYRCSGCKEVKPLADFHVLASAKTGRHGRCKDCTAVYDRTYRKKKRERHSA